MLFAASVSESLPGDFLWGAPQWMVPALVAAVVLLALVLWNYSQRGINATVRVIAMLLKLAAIGLIALCLLNPMRSGTRPRPQANVVPILIDNSLSMQVKTTDATLSRGEQISELMDAESDWRVRLAQAFDVREYAFDARLERIDSVTDMTMKGPVSSLHGSLKSLSERFADRPVGGVMLFTDGNMTDAPPADFDWSALGFPIYPVLPGDDDEVRDLRIVDVSTRQTDFESAPMTIRAKIDAVALEDSNAIVQLRDQATGELIEEKSVTLDGSGSPKEVKFQFRPKESGTQFYRIVAFTESDRAEMEATADKPQDIDTEEATLANNERLVAVERARGPYRILYMAGRPNWEFKFLRRSLEEDAEIKLYGLVRIADKEPKFSFRDRGVSTSNPLFQGLGGDGEDAAQQYNEPVIIPIGGKREELGDKFPDSPEELFWFHGVILDDIEPSFFTQDQLLNLRRFVAARGGGLLMLGGQESFGGKDFADSPLGELSPIYAPRALKASGPGAYRMQISREGMLQPWVRLRENESGERDRLSKMPTFTSVNPVGEIKPGASQLATAVSNTGKAVPALLAQRFGKGRTAAVPIADMWRWSMRRDDSHREDPAQMWRQMAHWLVNEVPRRCEVKVEKSKDPSKPVTIIATAKDDAYLPLDNAKVELEITPVGGKAFTINAEPDDIVAGQYRATYWSTHEGAYRMAAKITAADGSKVGEASSGWTAEANASEFSELTLNRDLLKRIARETGGEVIRDDDLSSFAADLPNRKIPVTETWVYPIWHRPWLMMLAILCLCGEWGLRRMRGLA